MLLFNMCEGPKKIWHHFGLFLSLFLAFHLKFLQLCKKPPSYISGTHQSLFPLVNNGQNWCQKLCTFFSPLLILQGECEQFLHITFRISDHKYSTKNNDVTTYLILYTRLWKKLISWTLLVTVFILISRHNFWCNHGLHTADVTGPGLEEYVCALTLGNLKRNK